MLSVPVTKCSVQQTRHVANLVQAYMVVVQLHMLFVVVTESIAVPMAIFAISQVEVVSKTNKSFY